MENLLDENSSSDLEVNSKVSSFLLESAKWGRFLAIVGFVMLGLLVIASLFMFVGGSSIGLGAQGGIVGITYLLSAVLYFFPTYYLFNFATKIKKGLTGSGQTDFDAGIENLKSMFKFMGILMIIVLALYAIMFLVGLAIGMS